MVRPAMDQFSYLIDRQHQFLLMGIILLIFVAACTLIGETLEPRRAFVYRAEEPRRFWWNIVFYFLAGLICIGVYLFQNSN